MGLTLLDISLPAASVASQSAAGVVGTDVDGAAGGVEGKGFFAALLSGDDLQGGDADLLSALPVVDGEDIPDINFGVDSLSPFLTEEISSALQDLQAQIAQLVEQLDDIQGDDVPAVALHIEQLLAQVDTQFTEILAAAALKGEQPAGDGKTGILATLQLFLKRSVSIEVAYSEKPQVADSPAQINFQALLKQLRLAYGLIDNILSRSSSVSAIEIKVNVASSAVISQTITLQQPQTSPQATEAVIVQDSNKQSAAQLDASVVTDGEAEIVEDLPSEFPDSKADNNSKAVAGVKIGELQSGESNAGSAAAITVGDKPVVPVLPTQQDAQSHLASSAGGEGIVRQQLLQASSQQNNDGEQEAASDKSAKSNVALPLSIRALVSGAVDAADNAPRQESSPQVVSAKVAATPTVIGDPDKGKEETIRPAGSGNNSAALVLSAGSGAEQTAASRHDTPFARLVQVNAQTPAAQPQPAVTDQVLVHIRQAVKTGASEIRVHLEPAHLGKVDVRLDISADGRTGIIVTADNRDSLDTLQREARYLERALNDIGLKTDAGNLNFNLRGGQQQQAGSGHGDQQQNGAATGEHGASDITTKKQEEENWTVQRMRLASADGLDITI